QGFVLTMGPYCPAEAPELLVDDALSGLVALGHAEIPFFPVPLTDINHLRNDSVPALAEWTVDALESAWQAEPVSGALDGKSTDDASRSRSAVAVAEDEDASNAHPPESPFKGGLQEIQKDVIGAALNPPLKGVARSDGGCEPQDDPIPKSTRGRPRRMRSK